MGRVFKKGKYWYVDYATDGKRHREKASRHKKLAKFMLNEIELRIERGELKLPNDIAIDEFFENFLKHVREHAKPKTLERYETVVKVFERYRIKSSSINRLSKVSTTFLEDFKHYRRKKVTKATVNHDLKVLTTAFNWAIKQNHVVKNPLNEVERFRVEKKQVRFFSKEEIRQILDHSSKQMYPAYMILLHTGMRKMELANLEWNDIDFERRIIKLQPKDGWSPKGRKGREVPISDELLEFLANHRVESQGRYIIEKINGKRYDRGLWLNFKRFARRLGIEDVNIHTFRHTFASYLVMAGVDLVTVKELLGHSEISTTMKYAHLTENHKQRAVNMLNLSFQLGTILAPTTKREDVTHLN